jgi:hypothetical protein
MPAASLAAASYSVTGMPEALERRSKVSLAQRPSGRVTAFLTALAGLEMTLKASTPVISFLRV